MSSHTRSPPPRLRLGSETNGSSRPRPPPPLLLGRWSRSGLAIRRAHSSLRPSLPRIPSQQASFLLQWKRELLQWADRFSEFANDLSSQSEEWRLRERDLRAYARFPDDTEVQWVEDPDTVEWTAEEAEILEFFLEGSGPNARPFPEGRPVSESKFPGEPARHLPADGDCGICHLPLSTEPDAEPKARLVVSEEVEMVFCYCCGKPFHQSCLRSWADYCKNQPQRRPCTCPNCRRRWKDD
jgi:hypothetical protein